MVDTDTDQQGVKMLSLKKTDDIDVEVSRHGPMNTTKSVAVRHDSCNCTEWEITTEFGITGYSCVSDARKY